MSVDMSFMDSRVLPAMARYSNITPLALESKTSKRLFMPLNAGQFCLNGSNNIIRIAISDGSSFLDSQLSTLSFQLNNAGTHSISIDGSYHSLIKRIRVISASGADIEDIRYYNVLHNMLSNMKKGPNSRFSSTEGYGLNGNYSQPQQALAAQVAGAGGAQATVAIAVQDAYLGVTAKNIGNGESILATGETVNVQLSLMSSILGNGLEKFLPLYLVGSLTLEIEIDQNAFINADNARAINFSINNVQYQAQMITFAGDVNSVLANMVLSGGVYIHTTQWSSFLQSIPIGNMSLQIAERLKSVKSILTCFCTPRTTKLMRAMSTIPNGITEYQLKIGSQLFPISALSGDSSVLHNSEFVIEVLKACGEYGNLSHTSVFNSHTFAVTGNTYDDVGKAAYGLDLDAFSAKNSCECGINTILNNPITVMTKGNTTACDCYNFLLYDAILSILPSGVFTLSK